MKCHWEKCMDLAIERLRWADDGAEAAYCDAHGALARMHGAALIPTRSRDNKPRCSSSRTGQMGAE
jgi:hypothetical protein